MIETEHPDLYVIRGILAMTPPSVHDYLAGLGRAWRGRGVAVEVGCWLGATSLSLLTGLDEAGYDLPYHAYDRWRASSEEVSKARCRGLELAEGQDLLPLYLANVGAHSAGVVAHQQDLGESFSFEFPDPVEICVLDAPKTDPLFTSAMDSLLSRAVPGVTVVGLLDYYLYERRPGRHDLLAPVDYMRRRAGQFERVSDRLEGSTAAFFRCR